MLSSAAQGCPRSTFLGMKACRLSHPKGSASHPRCYLPPAMLVWLWLLQGQEPHSLFHKLFKVCNVPPAESELHIPKVLKAARSSPKLRRCSCKVLLQGGPVNAASLAVDALYCTTGRCSRYPTQHSTAAASRPLCLRGRSVTATSSSPAAAAAVCCRAVAH